MQYNETIISFFKRMRIDYSLKEYSKAMCYNKMDINKVIAKYGMYKNRQIKKVCIANIVGKDRGKSQNLLYELNDLFDINGESYKKRSVSMLQYNSDEIISKLNKSFKEEPIELKEIKNGNYIIGNNGMHRVNLLKIHYLKELKECNSSKQIENLNHKYTLEVIVESIDILKTYSKYVLSLIDKNILVEDEINDEYMKTDNVIIYDETGEFKSYNSNQMKEFVKQRVEDAKNNTLDKEFYQLCTHDKNFREYMEFVFK